jgi:hypothetical protein
MNLKIKEMNAKHLLTLFIISMTALTACKKSVNAPVIGKWKEVKLRVYNQDKTTGAISSDTTYQASAFGKFDYAQFSINNTCILSQTGLQYGSTPQPVAIQDTRNYTYAWTGSGFALTEMPQNNEIINEVGTSDTVSSVSSNSLIIHSVSTYENPSVAYRTVGDAYYTK